MTTTVSIIAVLVTYCSTKRQHEESKKRLAEQKRQFNDYLTNQNRIYENEKRIHENQERCRERPYLIFEKELFALTTIDDRLMARKVFTNKGLDTAYEVKPILRCKNEDNSSEAVLIR